MRRCPKCAGPSGVHDTRETEDTVRRGRSCRVCGARWTTVEVSMDDYNRLELLNQVVSRLLKRTTEPRKKRSFAYKSAETRNVQRGCIIRKEIPNE